MDFLDKPLWSQSTTHALAEGSFLERLSDWPVSYKEVEQALGVPFHKQHKKTSGLPPWHGHWQGTEPVAIALLLCEFLRLREATQQAGAQKAYFMRSGVPLGVDHISAYIETDPDPVPLYQKFIQAFGRPESSQPHKVHTLLPLDPEWMDHAFYSLSKKNPDHLLTIVEIDLEKPWADQMGQLFGPAYQAILERKALDDITLKTAGSTPKTRRRF